MASGGSARDTTRRQSAHETSAPMAWPIHCRGWTSPPTCPGERDPVVDRARSRGRPTPVARADRPGHVCGPSRWLDQPHPPTRAARSCHVASGAYAATPAAAPGDKPRDAGWQARARRVTSPGNPVDRSRSRPRRVHPGRRMVPVDPGVGSAERRPSAPGRQVRRAPRPGAKSPTPAPSCSRARPAGRGKPRLPAIACGPPGSWCPRTAPTRGGVRGGPCSRSNGPALRDDCSVSGHPSGSERHVERPRLPYGRDRAGARGTRADRAPRHRSG